MDILASGTFSGVQNVDFVLTPYSSYPTLKWIFTDLRPSAPGYNIYIRTSSDGGSSYDATSGNYSYAMVAITQAANWASYISNTATPGTTWIYTSWMYNSAGDALQAEYTCFNRLVALPTVFTWRNSSFYNGDIYSFIGAGAREANADVDAVRFIKEADAATFAGKYALYGIK